MADVYRRRRLSATASRGGGGGSRDSGDADITDPIYLTRPELGSRRVRVLSGKGLESPGYTVIGDQPGALDEGVQRVRVIKMVSPLTGQGPADPMATGRYYGMNYNVLPVRIVRQPKAVSPNSNISRRVVRPPRSAIRRLNTRGQGTVGYY